MYFPQRKFPDSNFHNCNFINCLLLQLPTSLTSNFQMQKNRPNAKIQKLIILSQFIIYLNFFN